MKSHRSITILALLFCCTTTNLVLAQEVKQITPIASITPITLFPNGVPNAKKTPVDYVQKVDDGKTSLVSDPTMTPYFPEAGKANGTAVIICQGGAYGYQAGYEGEPVAKKFNELGITAFVLTYRLPSDKIMEDKSIGPLQDAQRAIQLVRQRAAEWKLNPAKIGIIGFSAGGHLASTAGTHFEPALIDNPDHVSLRPDFMLLIYPVITMGELTHKGSKSRLLGDNATQEKIDLFSNEKQVTANTPPTFIVHSANDKSVVVQNSLMLTDALVRAGVKTELHVYQGGGHGYAINNRSTRDAWFERCANWLQQNDFLAAR